MKWIGQHVWDYVSRFRSDVYLEDISTGTIASGGNLGLDSNNKIVKASEVGGSVDLTSEVSGILPVANGGSGASSLTDNSILTGTGTSAITAEANFTYNGTALSVNALTSTFTNATSSNVYIKNTGNNTEGGTLQFFNERPTGVDGDYTGVFKFWGIDDGGVATQSAQITTQLYETANSDECGRITLQVANDSTLRNGLDIIADKGTAQEVDVTIGNGAASTTTIAGDLSVTTGLILDSVDVTTIQTSAEAFANNDTSLMTSAAIQDEVLATAPAVTLAGSLDYLTISGQEITRNAIDLAADVTGVLPSANLDADTAHLTTDQTFTGVKMINTRRFDITAGGSAGEYMGDVVYTGTTTSMTAGDLYFYSSAGTWLKANAGATATSTGLLAISLGTASDTHGMLLRGMVTTSAIAGTPDEGAILYARASDGNITTVAPGSGDVVRIVGYCMENSNNRIWFDPDKTWVELA